MRHGMAHRKLGRTSSHRRAMFRNQLTSLITSERIVTTLIKAKELRPIIEKMVTLGRNDSVHSRRRAARTLSDEGTVQKLFTQISPRFATREGGYTRIVKLGPRRGDGAEMAILEFVDYTLPAGESSAQKKGGKKKAAPAPSAETKGRDDEEEKPKKEAKKEPKKAAPKKEKGEAKKKSAKGAGKKKSGK